MAKVTTVLYGELAIIPHQAEAPVTESYEFLTDTIQSYNGTEQGIPLRNAPRRFVSHSIPVQVLNDPALFNTVYKEIRSKWAIPMWQETQFLGVVAAETTVILCDTISHDLRPSSLALLWQDPENWQIIELDLDYGGGYVMVAEASTVREFERAFIIPVRVGYANESVARDSTGNGATFQMTYNIDDLVPVVSANPASFLSFDIYFDPTLKSEGKLTTQIIKQMETVDFDLGKVVYRSPWVNTRYASMYRVLTEGAAEAQVYRNFLHRRQGKFRRFWMPTFENNLRIKETNPTVTTTLRVHRDDYDPARTHVAIECDGVWTAHTLSGVSYPDQVTAQFTLTPSLSKPTASINCISYLGLYRLDADKVDLNWIGGIVMSSSVKVLELTP